MSRLGLGSEHSNLQLTLVFFARFRLSATMLAPSAAAMDEWTTVQDVVAWSGANAELWVRTATASGDPNLDSLLVLAGVSDEDFRTTLPMMQPSVTPLQRSSLCLTFNAVKTRMGVPTQILQTLSSAPVGMATAACSTNATSVMTMTLIPMVSCPR